MALLHVRSVIHGSGNGSTNCPKVRLCDGSDDGKSLGTTVVVFLGALESVENDVINDTLCLLSIRVPCIEGLGIGPFVGKTSALNVRARAGQSDIFECALGNWLLFIWFR